MGSLVWMLQVRCNVLTRTLCGLKGVGFFTCFSFFFFSLQYLSSFVHYFFYSLVFFFLFRLHFMDLFLFFFFCQFLIICFQPLFSHIFFLCIPLFLVVLSLNLIFRSSHILIVPFLFSSFLSI